MYVPLSDDKHRFVRDNSKKCTGNLTQNLVQDKFSLRQHLRQNSVREKIREFLSKKKDFVEKKISRVFS